MKKIFSLIMAVLLLGLAILTSVNISKTHALSLKAETIDFNCKAYILIDSNTGEVLLEKESEKHYEIASMVKLMTSLITMEKIESGELNLATKTTISEHAASQEGSQAFLDAHEEYTIEELLKSVIIASANDSSVALAETIGGNEFNFVSLMNKRAEELNLTNTLYANSTGLPALNQYSTAKDVALLLREVNKHDLYKNYSKIWMDKLVHPSGRETELVNTNRLVKYYPDCDCGKTGFTDEAGYCLSASAKRNGMRLIAVAMGCTNANDRFTITTNLLNFGFANYNLKNYYLQTDKIEYTNKIKGIKEKIFVTPEKDICVLTKKVDDTSLEIKTIFKPIKQKVNKGDTLGTILVIKNGIVIEEVNLIAFKDYNMTGLVYYFNNIVKSWK